MVSAILTQDAPLVICRRAAFAPVSHGPPPLNSRPSRNSISPRLEKCKNADTITPTPREPGGFVIWRAAMKGSISADRATA